MKNIFKYITVILASIILLWSCDEGVDYSDEAVGEGVSDFQLEAPIVGQEIILNSGTPDEVVTFSWEESKPGISKPVTYKLLFAETEDGLSDPLASIASENSGSDLFIDMAMQDLDGLAGTAGISAGGTGTLFWTVEATNGDQTKWALQPGKIVVTRFDKGIEPFSLLSPADREELEIDVVRKKDEVIVIDWEDTQSVPDGDITYTWVADIVDGDFSNPKLELTSDDDGTASELSVTHNALNDAIKSGFGSQVTSLKWKVIASNGTLTLSTQPNILLLSYFEVNTLYVLGSATTAGWDINNPAPLGKVSDGVFKTITQLTNGGEFKFVRDKGSWDINFGYSFFTTKVGESVSGGGFDNIIFNGTTGLYSVTADLATGTLTIKPSIDYIYLVGDATPAGWNPDNYVTMFRDLTNEVKFTYTGYLSSGYFKFLKERGQWAPQWGKGADGELVFRPSESDPDPSAINVASAGYYTITFNAGDGTYSVVPYDVTGATTYTSIAIIGSATPNGWSDGPGMDTDMAKYTNDDHNWYIDGQSLTANELKFRADESWTVNWGAATYPYGEATNNGPNVPITPAGDYLIHFCDLTGQYAIILK